MITANSLHLAIAGIVDYQSAIGDPSKTNRIYFSLIALGILSGFGGAPLLKSLSRRLRDTLTPEEKQEVAQVVKTAAEKSLKSTEIVSEFLSSAPVALDSPKTPEGDAARSSAIEQGKAAHAIVPDSRRVAIMLGRLYRFCDELSAGISVLIDTFDARKTPRNKDDADIQFNIACYRSLLAAKGGDEAAKYLHDGWESLKFSIKISPDNLAQALSDKDLEKLRSSFNVEELKGLAAAA